MWCTIGLYLIDKTIPLRYVLRKGIVFWVYNQEVILHEKKGGTVSRFLFLNLPFIYATYPLASGGQPSSASIFGLAGPDIVPVRRHRRAS